MSGVMESRQHTAFSLVTLNTRPGTAAACAQAACDKLAASKSSSLVGCWISEIGRLNEVTILFSFDDPEAQLANGAELRAHPESLGCEAALITLAHENLIAADGLPCITVGELGPFFELRRYQLKPGGLAPSLDAWRAAVPQRVELSPLALILRPVGPDEVLVQLWPYRSLDDRQAIRSAAAREGIWPPKDTLRWIEAAQSSILLPTSFSPLR